jgi:multidrug efflux pump subunit AcrA (membrane-fusion protein)
VILGQPVRIENPALKEPLDGKVLFVSSLANIQKNTLEVKVAIDIPPAVFKPEMLVNVTFLAPPMTGEQKNLQEEMRLYLPQQYVHSSDGGTFVWLVDQSEGVVRRTTVEAGAAGNNGLVEIKSGLTISSRVVTSGHENLQDGDRIRVREDSSSSDTAPASEDHNTLQRLPSEPHPHN